MALTPLTLSGRCARICGGAARSRALRLELKIAPKRAAPRLWPRYRQNMTDPVTTPRWFQPTVDWTPTTVQTDNSPRPPPRTNVSAIGCQTWALTGNSRNPATAARQIPAPISAVLRKPNRRNSRADCEVASGQPKLIVPSTAPAATAPRPSTSWP